MSTNKEKTTQRIEEKIGTVWEIIKRNQEKFSIWISKIDSNSIPQQEKSVENPEEW